MLTIRNILILLCILLFLSLPILAQEDVAESPPPTTETGEITLPAWMQEIAFAAVAISTGVSLLKRLPFLQNVSAPTINFVLSLAVWITYSVIKTYGDPAVFENVVTGFGKVLEVLISVALTHIGASATHKAAAMSNMPIVGYKRTA